MRRSNRRRAALALAIVAPLVAASARADGGFEPITPYRPSVSNPAQLPAPGQLEAEVGGLRQRSDDARRTSIPYLLKLAWSSEWGVLLGGEARIWTHDTDTSARGFGDTTLVLKRAWAAAEGTAFGLELGAKLPTANDTLGSGRADESLNGIYSQDLGPIHLDANLNATRLGRIDDGTSRWQIGASSSFSAALAERWGVTAELSGTRRDGASSSHQVLAALTFNPSKLLTLDVGIARAARPAPATTSFFAGAVFPLAKLW